MSDPVLVVDFGTSTSSAALVAGDDVRLIKEPATGSWSWPSAVCLDEDTILVGTLAQNVKCVDPTVFRDGIKRDLGVAARTVECVRALLDAHDVEPAQVDAVLLAGGSSRIPAVGDVVAAELGRPVRRLRDPELAVALGAARWARVRTSRSLSSDVHPPTLHPLHWRVPGGRSRLHRWLVEPGSRYASGARCCGPGPRTACSGASRRRRRGPCASCSSSRVPRSGTTRGWRWRWVTRDAANSTRRQRGGVADQLSNRLGRASTRFGGRRGSS